MGTVVGIPIQPPAADNNHELEAGVLTFGVEYRSLDPVSLEETYAGDADHLAELRATSPEGGFSDQGVSLHVRGTSDGHEYLRFDVFDDEPHYHYVHRTADGTVVNQVIDFDVTAHGDMLDWTLERLRTRLAAMLTAAGGADLADRIEPANVDAAIDDVERLARAARGARARADGRP